MNKTYLSGLGNHFSSEAIKGALPLDQNSPQVAPQGLYAEQLSGSAFTAPRHHNIYSWLYRIRPSVMHKAFTPLKELTQKTLFTPESVDPNQKRWNPLPDLASSFIDGWRTVCGHEGLRIHLYSFQQNNENEILMNADGEMLIVPQKGILDVRTEMGLLEVEPGEILIIPRGIKFQVLTLNNEICAGYIGENLGLPFQLPELGPIGANGLAHRRHFLAPSAHYFDQEGDFKLLGKFNHQWWQAEMGHHPLDVVAWHGNYHPYKYDLRKFNTMNTVSFDHPDPSIFTVLTSPSEIPGTANCDFAIFPPRWMVAEKTFRPPYFHRNCMSEYMGLIYGEYDAKTAGGFVPGGGSLHNFFSPHGPDAATFERASEAALEPTKIDHTMAFMFETRRPYLLTEFAKRPDFVQDDYIECWQNFKKHFG